MSAHLGYLEVQVTDSCNLRCKGCSHCAGLFGLDEHVPLEQGAKDLQHLSGLLPDIRRIRLLGGEPLLHPALAGYIRETRRAYQCAEIQVVTNGLLIPSVSDAVLYAMRENSVSFDISLYPPTLKIREQIERRLNAAEVRRAFTEPVTHFMRRLTCRSNGNAVESFQKCSVRWCHFLRKGELSPCPAPIILEKLLSVYGLELDISGGKLDLYRENLTGDEIADWMNHPNPVCRYCGEPELFDWEASKSPELSDWIRKDGMPRMNTKN